MYSMLDESPLLRLRRHLDQNGVDYELVESNRMPLERAAPERPAQTVLLYTDDGYAVAVIPASATLDLGKVQAALGNSAEPATAAELAVLFPENEAGVIPLFGRGAPKREWIDRRLLEQDLVTCYAGDHHHAIRLAPDDLLAVTSARIADLSA